MNELSNEVASQLQELYQLYTLQYVLSQMTNDLNLISQGAQGQVITVTNGNLYSLAAKYYGDATRWTTIAQANGFNSPYLSPTLFFQLVPQLSNQNLILTGTIEVPQILTVTVNNVIYNYDVLVTDNLNSIIAYFASVIPNTSANNNILVIPLSDVVSTSINRTLTITVPQYSTDSGGILPS